MGMEALIGILVSQPIYICIAAVLVIFLFFSLWKKLIKTVIVIALMLVLYMGYLTWTGKESSKIKTEIIEKGKKTIENIDKNVDEHVKQKIKDLSGNL